MKRLLEGFVLTVVMVAVLAGCKGEKKEVASSSSAGENGVDMVLGQGEGLFNENCAACHGNKGQGTSYGPPFMNSIYRPGHHSDNSFYYAVRMGVRSHHWNFGDMPPVDGLSDHDISEIIGYVRSLQKEASIY